MADKISEIMTSKVHTVEPQHNLQIAYDLISTHGLSTLPVIDPSLKNIVGTLTESDIILFALRETGQRVLPREALVAEAMNKNVCYCYPHSNAEKVLNLLIAGKIEAIPVIDKNSCKVLGTVGMTEYFQQLTVTTSRPTQDASLNI